MNDLPKPHHRQNSKSQFADDIALCAASKNVQFAAKLFHKGLRKLAKWCAKWRIKLNPEKTKVIIFSRSSLARNSEPILKLYGERLKIYPQVKFLGITFDSKFTYKQCVRSVSEYGSLLTITTSDTIINKIQRLQNKFIWLALRLPKYISVKPLHDSPDLPYMKDRLLFCMCNQDIRKDLQESFSRGVNNIQRVNPACDRFLIPLSVVRPFSLQITMTYRGNFSKHPIAPETGIPDYKQTRLAQSSEL